MWYQHCNLHHALSAVHQTEFLVCQCQDQSKAPSYVTGQKKKQDAIIADETANANSPYGKNMLTSWKFQCVTIPPPSILLPKEGFMITVFDDIGPLDNDYTNQPEQQSLNHRIILWVAQDIGWIVASYYTKFSDPVRVDLGLGASGLTPASKIRHDLYKTHCGTPTMSALV